MSLTRFPLRLATATITVVVAAGLALASASVARADTVLAPTAGVSASCSTLTVKPKGFAEKGELRVVVDGEVQTDGSAQHDSTGGDWRVFKGSFPGVYDFDPRVAHRYSVEVNSWGGDSDGRRFTPGQGADTTVTGSTTPCGPVSLQSAATNCVSPTRAAKQGLDLTIGDLRRSTTYLVEVLAGGDVVKHFQFRTQPEITKHFSGLHVGTDYVVRVTDQSDDSLSTRRDVTIPGCAAAVELRTDVSACSPDLTSRTITADVASLVTGRGYAVALTSDTVTALPVVSLVGDGLDHRVAFAGVSPGTYRVSVSDDAAPRTTRSGALVVADCAAAPGGPGTAPDPVASGGTTGPGTPSAEPGTGPGTGSPTGGTPGGGTAGGGAPAGDSAGAGGSTGSSRSDSGRGDAATVDWASSSRRGARSVVTVTADGSSVAVADPGRESAARPGAPTAVRAATPAAGLSSLAATLLWTGGGVAAAGIAGGGLWLVRRRVLAP